VAGEQLNVQTATTSGTEATSTATTLLGSLSSTGTQAMGKAHTLFTPPYSWMWRAAMSGAAMKYDGLERVAEIPELLGLITGYFANDPAALAAVKRARDNQLNDPFALSTLPQMLAEFATHDAHTTTPPSAPVAASNNRKAESIDMEEEGYGGGEVRR